MNEKSSKDPVVQEVPDPREKGREMRDYSAMEKTWNESITFEDVEMRSKQFLDEDMDIFCEDKNIYDTSASEYWESFFRRHDKNFYQDRNYLHTVWKELDPIQTKHWKDRILREEYEHEKNILEHSEGNSALVGEMTKYEEPSKSNAVPSAKEGLDFLHSSRDFVRVLECGCGAGNLVFPLCFVHPELAFYGIDFSFKAIEICREKSRQKKLENRVIFGVCDLVKEELPRSMIFPCSVDAATMVFCLGSIFPQHHKAVVEKIGGALAPGGLILFRDHGVYDIVMMRHLKKAKKESAKRTKLGDRLYARGEGTTSYFFRKEEVQSLFESAGFVTIHCDYVVREMVNRKRKITWTHVWVTGSFRKK